MLQAELTVRRCFCKSSWCPGCFKRDGLKRAGEFLNKFDYKKVRHIVLTVDRNKYEDGFDAWRSISAGRGIAQMIHNLKRSAGKAIGKWCWFLEWHRDGFPHWHVLVEMKQAGVEGQVGQENLLKYWGFGLVHEGFFKNEKHWRGFAGYFGKHGYFEKQKKHQAELPEWALKYRHRIRRFNTSHEKTPQEVKVKIPKSMTIEAVIRRHERAMRAEFLRINGGKAYEVILDECGNESSFGVSYMGEFGNFWRVPASVEKLKKLIRMEYKEGVGWVGGATGKELRVVAAAVGFEPLIGWLNSIEGGR